MTQINEIEDKYKQFENKKNNLSTLDCHTNYKEEIYSENRLLSDLDKEIQNLKVEYSMLAKKVDNIMTFNSNGLPGNLFKENENIFFTEIKNKIDKNEKEILNLFIK